MGHLPAGAQTRCPVLTPERKTHVLERDPATCDVSQGIRRTECWGPAVTTPWCRRTTLISG